MKHRNNHRTHRRRAAANPARQGIILAAVIVCLLVVMLVAGTLVRGIVVHRRQARAELQRLQAFWLAESAYRQAVAQLKSNPEYVGETWRTQPDAVGGSLVGMARIEVAPGRDQTLRRISITAIWPDQPIHRSRYTKESEIAITRRGDES